MLRSTNMLYASDSSRLRPLFSALAVKIIQIFAVAGKNGPLRCASLLPLLLLWAGGQIAWADTPIGNVRTGSLPVAVAVNTATNKIYVVNQSSRNITIIDGATNSTLTPNNIQIGGVPIALAVNPLTNRIYVLSQAGGGLTIIDGNTNTVIPNSVNVGVAPTAITINQATNKIYVTNPNEKIWSEIDGTTNTQTFSEVFTEIKPSDVVVNPLTNKMYIADSAIPSGLTEFPQANQFTGERGISFPVLRASSVSVAVNSKTNRVYLADFLSSNVTVYFINPQTIDKIAVIPTGKNPFLVKVNETTNTIYVATKDGNGNTLTVIDGLSNTAVNVGAESDIIAMAVNPMTNKIYTVNRNSSKAMVRNGATNLTETFTVGTFPIAVAVNPLTNRIYVVNRDSNNVTVVEGARTNVPVGSPSSIFAINPSNSRIYVPTSVSMVQEIDGTTNLLPTRRPIGIQASNIAINPASNKIYYANPEDNGIRMFNSFNLDLKTIVARDCGPAGMAFNSNTNKAYVICQKLNAIMRINGANESVEATIQLPADTSPKTVMVNPVTDKVYVLGQHTSGLTSVTAIRGDENAALITQFAFAALPRALVINPVSNKIYAVNEGFGVGSVSIIDGTNDQFLGNRNAAGVAVGGAPQDVAVNPVTNKIYVANRDSGDLTVVDGLTDAVVATIAVGGKPSAVAVDSITNRIYVLALLSDGSTGGNLVVIDGATNKTMTMPLDAGLLPRSLVVNQNINRIYLPNSRNNFITVIDGAEIRFPN